VLNNYLGTGGQSGALIPCTKSAARARSNWRSSFNSDMSKRLGHVSPMLQPAILLNFSDCATLAQFSPTNERISSCSPPIRSPTSTTQKRFDSVIIAGKLLDRDRLDALLVSAEAAAK